MTASQRKRRKQKRSIVTLRKNFEDVAEDIDELAEALDAGEADEALVADTYREIAASMASIEDAAADSDVIDPYEADWRAIDDLRAATYHAAGAIRLDDDPADAVIAPTVETSRTAALEDASAAAEYLEAAGDGEGEFADSSE